MSVPNVPDDVGIAPTHLDLQSETFHDADDFVPNACRESTLEKGTDFVKQVADEVVVETDQETTQEVKDEADEAILKIAPTHLAESATREAEGEATKQTSTARSTEVVGPQPATLNASLFLQSSVSSGSALRSSSLPPSLSDESGWRMSKTQNPKNLKTL